LRVPSFSRDEAIYNNDDLFFVIPATRPAKSEGRSGKSAIEELNFNQFLDTKDLPFPDPDLIIRTGGEQRLSGFMLWQSQYSELVFEKKYLPDYSDKDFENTIIEFSKRQRRFGK